MAVRVEAVHAAGARHPLFTSADGGRRGRVYSSSWHANPGDVTLAAHRWMVLAECLFRLAGDQAAAEDAVTYYKLCAGCVSGHASGNHRLVDACLVLGERGVG